MFGNPAKHGQREDKMGYYDSVDFESMVGKTFIAVEQHGTDDIVFTVSDTEHYIMLYHQDCCASCYIEDVCGDLQDLVGSPIVRAEQNSNEEPDLPPLYEQEESYTWTFYRIGTAKGTVVIRWYGSSNGYYSEAASFERME
jgi:hypothetical protein